MAADEYVVTRTNDDWPDDRYKITGGPPLRPGNSFNNPVEWVDWSWTLWSAKRKIKARKRLLARVDKIVYREKA